MQGATNPQMPDWSEALFNPCRYKVLYGGRGSGKSYAVADYLLIEGARRQCRVLCAREYQNSLSDSVLHLLSERVGALGLGSFYDVQREAIYGINGTSFIFKGVRNNVQSIKSMAGLTHLWLEEAQTVSKASWDVLIPTIRENGSEILVTFNPVNQDDPTYQMFVTNPPKDDAVILKVNWRDNPHWPEVLDKERKRLLENDPVLYAHVYEGECLTNTESQVFAGKWEVREFEVPERDPVKRFPPVHEPRDDWQGPYFGADFGFAADPSTLIRVWIYDGDLYIDHEAYGHAVELDDMPAFYDRVPDSRNNVIRADCARPETISYIRRQGFDIEAAPKWAGSVEDGIEHIRGAYKRVVIHPRCRHTANEFRLYSYKVDRLTGEIRPDVLDANNHCADALRYALAPIIQSKGNWYYLA